MSVRRMVWKFKYLNFWYCPSLKSLRDLEEENWYNHQLYWEINMREEEYLEFSNSDDMVDNKF